MAPAGQMRALSLLAGGRLPVDAIINRYASLDEGPVLFEELLVSPATINVRDAAVTASRVRPSGGRA